MGYENEKEGRMERRAVKKGYEKEERRGRGEGESCIPRQWFTFMCRPPACESALTDSWPAEVT